MGAVAIDLNHLIVYATDQWASARFLAGVLGVEAGPAWGPFVPVRTANGVTLDYDEVPHVTPGHYAFLVGDDEFDAGLARVRDGGHEIYADPGCQVAGEINHAYGGRGFYFRDPDGHLLELITAPYGEFPA